MQKIKQLIFILILQMSIAFNLKAQELPWAEDLKNMSNEVNPTKNINTMNLLIKKYNLKGQTHNEELDVLNGIVALSFLNQADLKGFNTYIQKIHNKFNQSSYLDMGANQLLKAEKPLLARQLAARNIELYLSYRNDPSARPANFPADDWNRFMKMAAYPYFETYTQTLYLNKNFAEALKWQQRILEEVDLEMLDEESLARYAVLLEIDGQTDKAADLLYQSIKVGKANLTMVQQFKKLQINKGKNEQETDRLIASLQENIQSAHLKKLSEKMLNITAPEFQLKDLDGKQVSLRDFRGKVVVLDFWATWCAPCIASMPAMQQLSKAHTDVVFLFIATQEKGTDAAAQVSKFLTAKKLSINVVMDRSLPNDPRIFEASTAYKLQGIPAKVVIDKSGQMRFQTSGYESDAALINEMNAMLTLVKTL